MIRFALASLVLGLSFTAVRAEPVPKPKDIDLVLCLDVSGSMNGLIDSAKIKLWDIVNELAKVKPVPNLRVSLFTYGATNYDRAKGWVRKDVDLTTDLDDVYAKLNALRTNGGEEYVGRVSQAALSELKWNEHALKIVFVCGNEPATQDPEMKLDIVAANARKAGVIVNTIYCGNADNAEAQGWSNFASLCGGKYANIDQNKAARPAIATPFDKELTELSSKINTTYVACGTAGKEGLANQAAQDSNASKLAPAAAAGRAQSKAEALYRCSWDLVDKMLEDPKKFDIKAYKDEDLPEEMRKLKTEERVKYLEKKAEERKEIQKKISELSAKRAKHIEEETKKQPKTPGEAALDDALKLIIREQATSKGFEVKK